MDLNTQKLREYAKSSYEEKIGNLINAPGAEEKIFEAVMQRDLLFAKLHSFSTDLVRAGVVKTFHELDVSSTSTFFGRSICLTPCISIIDNIYLLNKRDEVIFAPGSTISSNHSSARFLAADDESVMDAVSIAGVLSPSFDWSEPVDTVINMIHVMLMKRESIYPF